MALRRGARRLRAAAQAAWLFKAANVGATLVLLGPGQSEIGHLFPAWLGAQIVRAILVDLEFGERLGALLLVVDQRVMLAGAMRSMPPPISSSGARVLLFQVIGPAPPASRPSQ